MNNIENRKIIELGGNKVEYVLQVRNRARSLRLAVYPGGEFVVCAPSNLSENYIENFIIKKSEWVIKKIEHFKNIPKSIFGKNSKKEFTEHKGRALILVKNRIEHYNKFYGFKFNNVCIKNQKTRWGSCSGRGNLNFNYKIALLPEHLADYIVVHELCHLGEFNHSKRFWDLVAKAMPDHAMRRDELKNGKHLNTKALEHGSIEV